jgi:hypothetical protein
MLILLDGIDEDAAFQLHDNAFMSAHNRTKSD